jgi:hypothetical protein
MNQFELEDELGKGNYGTVRKVIHKPTKVAMAMKVSSRLSSMPPVALRSKPLWRRLTLGWNAFYWSTTKDS